MNNVNKRIIELEEEIVYEKNKMECYGYSKSDLYYLSNLENELEKLKKLEDEDDY